VGRLDRVMFQKQWSEIAGDMPPRQEMTIRLDPIATLPPPPAGQGTMVFVKSSLGVTLDHKIDTIVENVLSEMAEGRCCFVLTYLQESAQRICAALEEEIRKPEMRACMNRVNATVWLTYGSPKSEKERFDLARTVREHAKNKFGGALVSTHDAMQTGLSLAGVASTHVTEFHHSPAALRQARDRPLSLETRGFSVIYYVLKKSIDEQALLMCSSKLETQAIITKDEGARELRKTLTGEDPDEKDVEEMWSRLTAHLRSEKDDGA
jgi:hypothetical protein